jgi:hypothetical protein
MYLYFCIIRSTSLANLDAGTTMHSFFLRVSLLYRVVNRLDKMLKAGISVPRPPSLIFDKT